MPPSEISCSAAAPDCTAAAASGSIDRPPENALARSINGCAKRFCSSASCAAARMAVPSSAIHFVTSMSIPGFICEFVTGFFPLTPTAVTVSTGSVTLRTVSVCPASTGTCSLTQISSISCMHSLSCCSFADVGIRRFTVMPRKRAPLHARLFIAAYTDAPFITPVPRRRVSTAVTTVSPDCRFTAPKSAPTAGLTDCASAVI